MAFGELRQTLVELHRVLLEAERRDYERLHGRLSDGEFLEVVIKDPDLRWLGALTTLIVSLDELGEQTPGRQFVAHIRKLLMPTPGGDEFNRKYDASLQRNPEVVVAHGGVMRALGGAGAA